MKNAFELAILILTAGFPALVASSMLGVLAFYIPSVFELIGLCAAFGVLAFALRDYNRTTIVGEHADKTLASQNSPVPFVPTTGARASGSAVWLKAA